MLLLESSPSSPLPHHTATLYVRPRNPVRCLSPSQSPCILPLTSPPSPSSLLPPPSSLDPTPPSLLPFQGAMGWTSSRARWGSGVHRSGPGTSSQAETRMTSESLFLLTHGRHTTLKSSLNTWRRSEHNVDGCKFLPNITLSPPLPSPKVQPS